MYYLNGPLRTSLNNNNNIKSNRKNVEKQKKMDLLMSSLSEKKTSLLNCFSSQKIRIFFEVEIIFFFQLFFTKIWALKDERERSHLTSLTHSDVNLRRFSVRFSFELPKNENSKRPFSTSNRPTLRTYVFKIVTKLQL